MLSRVDVRGRHGDMRAVLARPAASDDTLSGSVAEIIADVRARGDEALAEWTERFDGCDLPDFRVPVSERQSALGRIDPDLVVALEFARDQILAWHEAQREKEAVHERFGVHVREMVLPVDRAGCYVPGGRAAYPSSVLMTGVPARVAGVPEVVLCTPPGPDGRIPDITLAASMIAGVDEVYRVGGVQAIAALAYGTESIRPADVIVGPGNAFVAEAKRQVVGAVGIDSIAGPSEVVIVADDTVDPALVAADLIAQAEHGPGGAVVVITWHEPVVAAVDDALARLLNDAPRAADITGVLREGGRAVIVDDPHQAMDAANALAPEHLQLMCADAELLVPSVRHAGAVFVGANASAVLGDYAAGVNHVLPTGGAARFSSALRVATFQKHVHVVSVDDEGLARLAPYVTLLADSEGLHAHAQALRMRERGV
jgi:histidinol dehydrogenase